jgi:hypothetical protein
MTSQGLQANYMDAPGFKAFAAEDARRMISIVRRIGKAD